MKKSTKKASASRGRPKSDPVKAFTCRHVLNISPEMEGRIERFRERNGIARATDAMRQLLTIALRAEDQSE